MAWILQVPLEHRCSMPGPEHYGIGSIWKCDYCSREWTIIQSRSLDRDGTAFMKHTWMVSVSAAEQPQEGES